MSSFLGGGIQETDWQMVLGLLNGEMQKELQLFVSRW